MEAKVRLRTVTGQRKKKLCPTIYIKGNSSPSSLIAGLDPAKVAPISFIYFDGITQDVEAIQHFFFGQAGKGLFKVYIQNM